MALSDYIPQRKIKYGPLIQAETASARSRYFSDKANALQQAQFDQSASQFDQTLALQKEQAKQAEEQANVTNAIAGLGLAKTVYPYAKSGAGKLSNLIFGSSPQASTTTAAPAATTTAASGLSSAGTTAAAGLSGYAGSGEAALTNAIAPAYQTPGYSSLLAEGATQAGGVGAGEGAVASGAESAFPTGASATPYGWIVAAIIAQHMAAQGTNRTVEGQRVGDVFSYDENGNWSPWFLNDPWHEYLGTQWGFERPSGGVNLEAAIKNSDWGNAAKRVSQGFNQWADPIGDFGYDVIENYLGKNTTGRVGQYINPVANYSDKLADSKDIGGFLGDISDSGGLPGDPIGPSISGLVNVASGKESVFDTAKHVLTGGLSHFCTAINMAIGMSKIHTAMMNILRNWSIENRPNCAKHYFKFGGTVVERIREQFKSKEDERLYFSRLKNEMVFAVLNLMSYDRIEDAFNLYWNKYCALTKEFAPELLPEAICAQAPKESTNG